MVTLAFDSEQDYIAKIKTLQNKYQHFFRDKQVISLRKKTSNLFRHRNVSRSRLDVRQFNRVIKIDLQNQLAIVEGMTTYEKLVDATLQYGYMPTVVPELKTITIGGALSGIGIESSSFRYGLVHETIIEFDVLLGDGRVVTCRADNEYSDLFFAFPNSYGTLGYALKVVVKIIPVKPYVKLVHTHFTASQNYFAAMQQLCWENHEQGKISFIDGAVFHENEMCITTAEFVDNVPYTSNYQYMKIYYRSVKDRTEDYLTVHDYIWRWDADWFWCSKFFYLQNFIVRILLGKFLLKSKMYWKLKNLAHKNKLLRFMQTHFAKPTESVIQDVAVPVENAELFFQFFNRKIGIKPFWNCPVIAYQKQKQYDLFKVKPEQLYVNFGFWDVLVSDREPGYYNRLIEKKVTELQGIKSLYSSCFYTQEEFWEIYDKNLYNALKNKYDSHKVFNNLYVKCTEKMD